MKHAETLDCRSAKSFSILYNINLFTLWKYCRICQSVQLSVQYRQLITDQQLHAQYLCHHLIELLELRLIDLE